MLPRMKSYLFLLLLNLFILSNTFGQCVVRGKVTDTNGEILIGVIVYPKSDLSSGTVTDVNGDFSLKTDNSKNAIME